jgi:3-oxoacyl-[acyl-carrier-protein] synthase III
MNGPLKFSILPQKKASSWKNTQLIKLHEKVDHFIFHQANAYMLNHLRKKIKIEVENLPQNGFFVVIQCLQLFQL